MYKNVIPFVYDNNKINHNPGLGFFLQLHVLPLTKQLTRQAGE